MKSFTVTWWPHAEDELSRLWMEATDRRAVALAGDEIDRLLADDAASQGEPSSEGLRRLTIAPLSVQFTVDEGDRKVVVWTVRSIA